MKEVIKYLLKLSLRKQKVIMNLMVDGQSTTQGNEPAACGKTPRPPLSQGDTPYGYWHCDGSSWVWVPDLG